MDSPYTYKVRGRLGVVHVLPLGLAMVLLRYSDLLKIIGHVPDFFRPTDSLSRPDADLPRLQAAVAA